MDEALSDAVAFGSRWYLILLHVLVFARGMDLLSTWLATPSLALEANPLARRLGWKWGLVFNAVFCAAFAAWPLPAVIISTTSVLVAARNFQGVWLMRTLGEEAYRHWMVERVRDTTPGLYLGCLFTQVGLVAVVGLALVFFTGEREWVPFGIGVGILAYALAVLIFTLLSVWRLRRNSRHLEADGPRRDDVFTNTN
jgi:hypothetical protein